MRVVGREAYKIYSKLVGVRMGMERGMRMGM